MGYKRVAISLRGRALQCLARREYSRAELRAKLLPHVEVENDFEQVQPNAHGKNSTRHARFPHLNPLPQAGEEANESLSEIQVQDLDALLDDLTARGWLSDARAATQFVHAKRPRFGTQRITQELCQRGISSELIEATLPVLQETELDTAREVWQRKYRSAPVDAKEKAKQMRFLQSRGFSFEIIAKVFRSLGEEES
ncbi:MAG: regulatory protein RecX [Sideroxydans sp.]|nr:regulatory protein RecX [Sideroxydans sp.]